MILFDDNYERMLKQLKDEKERVDYYLRKNAKKVGKMFLKARTLPVFYCETMNVPSTNNTYLLYYYTSNYEELMAGECFHGAPLLLNDREGRLNAVMYRKMTLRGENIKERIDYIQIFTGHFFSRYRERMKLGSSLTTNEVIASFFGRNGGYYTELYHDEFVLDESKCKSNSAWAIEDGVTLATSKKVRDDFYVAIHNTFLSRAELKDDQKQITPSVSDMRAAVLMLK